MRFFIKFVVLLLLPRLALAQSNACESGSNFSQVIACIESKSSEVLRAKSVLDEKTARMDASSQLLNPELSANSVYGNANSQSISETDIALSFPIELGGQRAARKEVAQKDLTRAEAEFLKVKAEVRKQAILKLVRLRQVYDELALVKESLATFSKLVKQYESRLTLSPEQEVTLMVFRLAKGEYGLKQVEYEDELSQIEVYLQLTAGLSLATIKNVLPGKVKTWEDFDANSSFVENSPVLVVMQSEIEMAQAEMNRVKGETWGTMAIGPSAKFSKDGSDNKQQFGINLSMPLPLLSLNQGARAAANASLKSAELRKQLAITALIKERESLFKTYLHSRKALEEVPYAIEERHRKVEKFFAKGIVPSSLVIEVHRTMVDFEKNRNEREMKAIDSLLTLQFIDGRGMGLKL